MNNNSTAPGFNQIESRTPSGNLVTTCYYPAFFEEISKTRAGEKAQSLGEATCYYYPDKKAVAVCSVSGRFLSELCDIEIDGVHYSPDAFNSELAKGNIKNLKQSTPLYDGISFGLMILPVLFLLGIPYTFATAPLSIYYALRYWNQTASMVPRNTKTWLTLALIGSSIQLLLWLALLTGLIIYLIVDTIKQS